MNDMNKENSEYRLKKIVMDRIEQDKVCPWPRSRFLLQQGLVWGLWLVGTLVGAIAIAVTLFVVSFHRYIFLDATQESIFTFLVEVLPYLWFFIIVLAMIFSARVLRYTKRGHRYPTWKIILASLIISLAGGTVLHLVGVGLAFDEWLGKSLSVYESQDTKEQKIKHQKNLYPQK